jgi:hypothetical protein
MEDQMTSGVRINNSTGCRAAVYVAAVVLACVLIAPLRAQKPVDEMPPSEKNPLRFSAFGVSMQAGVSGRIEIAIERWTTDQERIALLNLLAEKGQDKLVDALQDIKGRLGYIRTSNSLGWSLKYCRDNRLPDGTRQIVIATDKPVSFLAQVRGSRTLDYPFTLLELRMQEDGKGEGKMLAQTALNVKNGRLEIENYGQEPVRLTTITQDKQKD